MALVAFITGITGQDGSYLADGLLDKGYRVYGNVRRKPYGPIPERYSSISDTRVAILSSQNHARCMDKRFFTKLVDYTSDCETIIHLIWSSLRFIIMAAQSHVKISHFLRYLNILLWSKVIGTLKLLECHTDLILKKLMKKSCDSHQVLSTSEMYGKVLETPQTETTPYGNPQSPNACAKVYSHFLVI